MSQTIYPPQYPLDPLDSTLSNDEVSSIAAPWLIRLPLLAFGGGALLIALLALFVAAHQLQYDGLIYPGVSAYGVALGGMTHDEAQVALNKQFTYGAKAIFTFRDGTQSWPMSAAALGVSFDSAHMADQAFAVGRSGGLLRGLGDQWRAWFGGTALAPTIIYDESRTTAFLQKISTTVNRPMQDATILLTGTTVTTTPSQVGHTVDIPATLGLLRTVILNMNTGAEIRLITHETPPAIVEAENAAAQVRTALAGPIQLYVDNAAKGEGPWQLTPDFVARLITIPRIDDGNGKAHYAVNITISPVASLLQNIASQLQVDPVDARFVFNDTTKQLQVTSDSVNGRSLDIDTTMAAIQSALFSIDKRHVPLAFRQIVPVVNSQATAQQLGITDLLVSATTHFYGSTQERRTNIQVAAAKFQGLVIKPGEEFSFDKYLGDVSPETGFETGLIIFGNQTIKGVGGGVCQVSTTVFQAAFFGGFPINQRYPHGYRVGYYESGSATANGQTYNSGAGLDATVYSPQVDMLFTNDTPYYLLIEEFFDPAQQSLTFKLYSTSSGRVVTKDGPYISNPVPHGATVYQDSTDIAPGQLEQVDYAVDGSDVHVYRTITQNGKVLVNREDFFSHYLPWQAIFLRGVARS